MVERQKIKSNLKVTVGEILYCFRIDINFVIITIIVVFIVLNAFIIIITILLLKITYITLHCSIEIYRKLKRTVQSKLAIREYSL